MKLSTRLATMAQQVSFEYEHIWDCCCDHGYLGFALLEQVIQRQLSAKIHFVDCVAAITDPIAEQLHQREIDSRYWQVHCEDVAQLTLKGDKGLRHLVIIAGVGGELTLSLVQSLLSRHPTLAVDFMLCPVHHQYELRQGLMNAGLRLHSEQLLHENGRYYELITVSACGPLVLSAVGSLMWQTNHELHLAYIMRKIQHYQRLRLGAQPVEGIIAQYQTLLETVRSEPT